MTRPGAPYIITLRRNTNVEGLQTLTTWRKSLLSTYNDHVTCLYQQYHACLLCFLVMQEMNFSEV
ncbi:hypothetical protein DUQ00_20845 [Salmonella bongori]|uniref:Uncharacterized protein n=2 Tax=Salmonella bongori TaxID=54736 RepID=A0A702FF44_SALBN|nr:hypothetical protein [Salmonella bongori]HAC6694114.1 hypothetical protein [Salmonella bongori serovar 44:r:-]ECC9598694.1 hypothetical protein [Salmonella bongori]ECE6546613.1 hypothetical protein [Salmonella bongori]ECG1192601.1 hypothetical protein [Salmonella bongori]